MVIWTRCDVGYDCERWQGVEFSSSIITSIPEGLLKNRIIYPSNPLDWNRILKVLYILGNPLMYLSLEFQSPPLFNRYRDHESGIPLFHFHWENSQMWRPGWPKKSPN
jgi:hypothetical protein